jgi:hypothetical protein
MTVAMGETANLAHLRSDVRIPVALDASVTHVRGNMAVRLIDLSRSGAAAETAAPPPTGAGVTLRLGELVAAGRVLWVDGRRFGIGFDKRIRATDVLLQSHRARGA